MGLVRPARARDRRRPLPRHLRRARERHRGQPGPRRRDEAPRVLHEGGIESRRVSQQPQQHARIPHGGASRGRLLARREVGARQPGRPLRSQPRRLGVTGIALGWWRSQRTSLAGGFFISTK